MLIIFSSVRLSIISTVNYATTNIFSVKELILLEKFFIGLLTAVVGL